MSESKLHICGLCKSGDTEELKASLLPLYDYYDALQYVIHEPIDTELYDFLDSIKKDGKIIKTEWCQRLDFARNNYLFRGNMKTGEFFINLDSKEKLFPEFFKLWPQLKEFLIKNNIDGVLLSGKRFLYRYSEFLEHRGNPHEYIANANNVVELTSFGIFKDTSWYWHNVHTDGKRDKYQYIWHFINYYCFPASNHCLLGRDNNQKEFYEHDAVRREFRLYCEKSDLLPLTQEKFIWLCNNKLDDIRKFVNYEKYLNDGYHYFINGREEYEKTRTETSMVIV